MVQGQKRWTFASADYTWLLYPLVNQTCQTLISPLCLLMGRRYDIDYIRKHFPLFEFCPRQEVTLEPGDVLFNPAWSWHNVENLTRESIAVSSRWIHPILVSHNRFVECCMLFSSYLNRRRFSAMLNRGFSISDENVREIIKTRTTAATSGDQDRSSSYASSMASTPCTRQNLSTPQARSLHETERLYTEEQKR